MVYRLFIFALVLIAGDACSARVYEGKVSHVTDGDTLWVQLDRGGPPRKLRIDGIDAPEICQPGGEASRNALAQRVLNQRVQVSVRRNDMYGRGLARIQLGGRDVGGLMVSTGQAWSYRWRRDAGPYAAEEAVARQYHLGLFVSGQPEQPRDFRKRHGSCHSPR